MSWIEEIEYGEATGVLRKLYDRVKGPDDNVDNVLKVHSLRPHSLTGHMALYKNVLHHSGNTLPKWYLETVGVLVSMLNRCDYCVAHHAAGLRRLLKDDKQFELLYVSLENGLYREVLEEKYAAGLDYAKKVTWAPDKAVQEDIHHLRSRSFVDGEILELNQVASYFNYVNRSVLGLGVNTDGDILGLSPNDNSDAENWGHS